MTKKYKLQKFRGVLSSCWFCGGKAQYILDDQISEIFVCLSCCKKHYKNSKLLRRVLYFEKSKKIKNKKILHRKFDKNTHISPPFNHSEQGAFSPARHFIQTQLEVGQ